MATKIGINGFGRIGRLVFRALVDKGLLGSKPYAASGAYIDRMSDYCTGCTYKPKLKLGDHACPFNYLYWYFLLRNEKRLASNPRMGMPYRTLARMSAERRQEIIEQARIFLRHMEHRLD